MAEDKKEQLIDFLNRRAFDPVLYANPENYSGRDRELLQEVQDRTQKEKERYYEYEDAAKVRQMFQDDLSSEPAQKIHSQLHRLNLPALPDIKDEFFEYADKLGVTKGER